VCFYVSAEFEIGEEWEEVDARLEGLVGRPGDERSCSSVRAWGAAVITRTLTWVVRGSFGEAKDLKDTLNRVRGVRATMREF
jgi:hypothetical protein